MAVLRIAGRQEAAAQDVFAFHDSILPAEFGA
jgi:hypothetical protein